MQQRRKHHSLPFGLRSDLINISATSTVLRISTLALVFLGLIGLSYLAREHRLNNIQAALVMLDSRRISDRRYHSADHNNFAFVPCPLKCFYVFEEAF
jgi:hypothetical protein